MYWLSMARVRKSSQLQSLSLGNNNNKGEREHAKKKFANLEVKHGWIWLEQGVGPLYSGWW